MKNYIIAFLLLLFISSAIYPQTNDNFRIDRTNSRYRLGDWIGYSTTRWIRSIAQGNECVYFATSGGITRFNYYSKKWESPWTICAGLADNDVYIVAYDLDTNFLWCVTSKSISCFFSTFEWWENYYFDHIDIPSVQDILAIGFDKNHVWIKQVNGNITKGNKHGGEFFQSANKNDIDNSTVKWYGYQVNKDNKLPNFFMDNGYWFDNSVIQDIRLNRYEVSSWKLDKWGNYWIGTNGLGLGIAEERIEHLQLQNYGLFHDNVSAMALDTEQNIMWIGGLGDDINGESGVTSWDIEVDHWSYFQAKYTTNFTNDQVNAIALDENYIWFGTEYGLVNYNTANNQWITYDRFSYIADEYIYDIALDDENVWVATENGLSRIIKNTIGTDSLVVEWINRSALRNIKIFDVEVMHNLVWLGTEFGVYIYDLKKNVGGFQAETGGPMNEPVYAVSCFKDEIWFGTAEGVEVFDINIKKWLGGEKRRFGSSDKVNYIKASEAAVWVGTADGVLKYDRERNYWIRFTMDDGLLDNYITSIVLDGDYVWFGTAAGITRFYWNDPYRVD